MDFDMEMTGSLDCALGHRVEEDAEHEVSDDTRDVQDRADETADGAARDEARGDRVALAEALGVDLCVIAAVL